MASQSIDNKLRWQSRRGTLELDLLLQRYWQQTPPTSPGEQSALAELLALDDEDLMRVIDNAGEGKEGGAGLSHLSQPARRLAATLAR